MLKKYEKMKAQIISSSSHTVCMRCYGLTKSLPGQLNTLLITNPESIKLWLVHTHS